MNHPIHTQPRLVAPVLTLLLALVALPPSLSGEESNRQDRPHLIGVVTQLQGTVLVSTTSTDRELSTGDQIFEGDRLHSKPDTRITLQMIDDALITAGSLSQVEFRQYRYDGEAGSGLASTYISSGAFKVDTGRIADLAGHPFTIKTPLAVIGVRGTGFWGGSLDHGESLEFALLSGKAIYVENSAGRTVIDQPGYGTRVYSPRIAPSPPERWPSEKMGQAVETVLFKQP